MAYPLYLGVVWVLIANVSLTFEYDSGPLSYSGGPVPPDLPPWLLCVDIKSHLNSFGGCTLNKNVLIFFTLMYLILLKFNLKCIYVFRVL